MTVLRVTILYAYILNTQGGITVLCVSFVFFRHIQLLVALHLFVGILIECVLVGSLKVTRALRSAHILPGFGVSALARVVAPLAISTIAMWVAAPAAILTIAIFVAIWSPEEFGLMR